MKYLVVAMLLVACTMHVSTAFFWSSLFGAPSPPVIAYPDEELNESYQPNFDGAQPENWDNEVPNFDQGPQNNEKPAENWGNEAPINQGPQKNVRPAENWENEVPSFDQGSQREYWVPNNGKAVQPAESSQNNDFSSEIRDSPPYYGTAQARKIDVNEQ